MCQAVSRRPLTAVTQVKVCGICGGQSGNERGISQRTSGFPLSLPFHRCSILIFIYTLLLPEGQADEIWAPSKKAMPFSETGENCLRKYFHLEFKGFLVVSRNVAIVYVRMATCHLCVWSQEVKQIHINNDTIAPLPALL